MLNIEINFDPQTEFNYAPNPPFGSANTPVILWFDIKRGQTKPDVVHIEKLDTMALSPFCSSLHYGQSIFEGLKAYYLEDQQTGIFRPDKHAERFSQSAKKMAMTPVSAELFMDCLESYMKVCKQYIPKEEGHSLYLRPLLFASDPIIKLRTAESYRFMIMSSVVGNYFKKDQKGSRVLINKTLTRAFPGGTGEAKTASNYALSLKGLEHALAEGFDQVLYLDLMTRKSIEELGGMNFFMVKEGKLFTPELDGQILHGVTRKSILEIAQFLGIETHEKNILLSEVIDGQIHEIFASGTAASISNIDQLGIQDDFGKDIELYDFNQHELTFQLRDHLVDTQRGKTELSKKWLFRV